MAHPQPNHKTPATSTSAHVLEAQRALNAAEATRPQGSTNTEDSAVEKFAEGIDTVSKNDGLSILFDGVNSFVESLPGLVKVLDEVAKIHPFTAVAVGAFKVVIELEVKRRDNDKKVNLLFFEMRNMMSALAQLQTLRADHVARDGMSIGARLEELVNKTAKDIKECANACDTYSKKRLVVKVFKGPAWDETLKGYIQLFGDRKAEFNFAVSIHTGLRIDNANDKLDSLMSKMDLILEFFDRTVPASQRTLSNIIQQVGGAQAILQQPWRLQELLDRERSFETSPTSLSRGSAFMMSGPGSTWAQVRSSRGQSHQGFNYSRSAEAQRTRRRTEGTNKRYGVTTPASGAEYGYRPGPESWSGVGAPPSQTYVPPTSMHSMRPQPWSMPAGPGYRPSPHDSQRPVRLQYPGPMGEENEIDFEQEEQALRQELASEPKDDIRRNMKVFERKFEIQHKELREELKKIMVHQGDRIISSVLAGPHERIVDPDLYEIWKDMRWRGIVKARHLVLAIHDYYLQKLDDQELDLRIKSTAKRRISEDDAWTLEFIDLMHLQPIVEAFDEDASGYITIQEVNQFTTSRPKGWSLLHWLAYWAVGWQVTMTAYKRKISALLTRFEEMRESVRLPNHWKISRYLGVIPPVIQEMTQSFQGNSELLFLIPRFQSYMDQEERRLRGGLETVKYDIDALDTLALINGRRGLERNLFVLLYLILMRHYEMMRLGQTYVLHPQELADAEGSVFMVEDAFDLRRAELSTLFQQRRLIVPQEIGEFACGMFSLSIVSEPIAVSDDTSDAASLDLKLPSTTLLKYPVHFEDFYPDNDDGLEDNEDYLEVDDSVKPILGRWSAILCTQKTRYAAEFIFSVHFHASPSNKEEFVASPRLLYPWPCSRADVVGRCTSSPSSEQTYAFTVYYNSDRLKTEYFRVSLSSDGATLTGDYAVSPDFSTELKERVIMKKDISPEIMTFYPNSITLAENKPRALWHYAISAVLHQVQQRTLTWPRLKARRDLRHRLGSFYYCASFGGRLLPEEDEELARLVNRLPPAEMHRIVYTAIQPDKFAWISPQCSQGSCSKILKTTTPCIRCCSCVVHPGYQRFGLVFCPDDLGCLISHVQDADPGPYYSSTSAHCILKTRTNEWTLDAFSERTGKSFAKLMDQSTAMRLLLMRDGARTPHSDEAVFSHHRLSTISEVTEDDATRVEGAHSESTFGVVRIPSPSEKTGRDPVEREAGSEAGSSASPLATTGIIGLQLGSVSDVTAVSESSGESSGSCAAEDTDDGVRSPPQLFSKYCIECDEEVTLPCWLCAECIGYVFICEACDRRGGVNSGDHMEKHTLLWIYDPGAPALQATSLSPIPEHSNTDSSRTSASDQDRPRAERMSRIEDRLMNIEERFGTVDDRLVRMESLLETVLALLRASARPSSDVVTLPTVTQ